MTQQINNNEDTIDLKELFFSLLARWKLITICVLLSLLCAFLYLRVTPNTYSVDALVQVEDKKGASAALLGDLSNIIEQKSPAQAEIEILKSRLVLGQVINNLNLDTQLELANNSFRDRLLNPVDYQLDYHPQGVSFQQFSNHFNIQKFEVAPAYLDKEFSLSFSNQKFILELPNTGEKFTGQLNQTQQWAGRHGLIVLNINSNATTSGDFVLTKLSLRSAVQMLSGNYSVAEKGKLTGILGLNYQGTDKEQITVILNEVLKTYIAQNIERRSAETQQTLKFLDQQLPDLKKQLDDSERAFNRFREQYNTVDVSKESELLLAQSVTLESTRLELQQKQAELSAKYTTAHPLMNEINAQLAEITAKQKTLAENLKRLPEVQRQYLQLYRDVEVNSQLYTTLLNSYQQLRVAKAGEIGNIRVVDYAVEPIKPIKPQKLQILILAIFLGGFLGTLIALLLNMMRSGIRDSAQIEATLGLPVYGTIPKSAYQPINLKKKAHIPVLSITHGDDIAIESLRSVRTTLVFALAQAKSNILLITSSAPETGKSFISTNLAALLAQNNKKVLLIDADLRRGYLHKYFKNQNVAGLAELLIGQVSLEQAIHITNQDNLSFLPRGTHPNNPSEMLNSESFSQLMTQLKTLYDYIIIDSPPILAVTDGLILSKYSGVNICIARYAKTQMREIELVMSRFENVGHKINGVILNQIQTQNRDAKYGYQYAYNYSSDKK